MILELFTYVTTKCPRYVRRMGYLTEAIGLKCRYNRHPDCWQLHLEKTRQFILSAADRCRNRGRVVVLGSGLLLDVPLKTLASLFREVVLIDIVCLPEVLRHIKRYDNVKFFQRDVTNIAEALYRNVISSRYELPYAEPVIPEIGKDTGLVISLNILSQLAVIPRAYALKKIPGITKDSAGGWCRKIIEAHYAFLASLSSNVCLVADCQYTKRDRAGGIAAQGSTVYGMPLPEPDDSWVWNIAPIGEEPGNLSKELTVGAWNLR